jgi:hypothetical protein
LTGLSVEVDAGAGWGFRLEILGYRGVEGYCRSLEIFAWENFAPLWFLGGIVFFLTKLIWNFGGLDFVVLLGNIMHFFRPIGSEIVKIITRKRAKILREKWTRNQSVTKRGRLISWTRSLGPTQNTPASLASSPQV